MNKFINQTNWVPLVKVMLISLLLTSLICAAAINKRNATERKNAAIKKAAYDNSTGGNMVNTTVLAVNTIDAYHAKNKSFPRSLKTLTKFSPEFLAAYNKANGDEYVGFPFYRFRNNPNGVMVGMSYNYDKLTVTITSRGDKFISCDGNPTFCGKAVHDLKLRLGKSYTVNN